MTLVRLLLALMVVGLAIAALKVAIIAIFVAGLIFRPRETVGTIVLFGSLALVDRFPVASLVVAALAVAYVLYAVARGSGTDPATERLPLRRLDPDG